MSFKVAFVSNIEQTADMEAGTVEATTQPLDDQIRRMTPVAAPAAEQAQVAALYRALASMVHDPRGYAADCRLVGPQGESITLPESVLHVLERVAEVMARARPASTVACASRTSWRSKTSGTGIGGRDCGICRG
jgi:hypothetical protein